MRMTVPVVQVRIVRVPVDQARVAVPMGVRLAGRRPGPVDMLVVRVVDVPVLMFKRLMLMLVFVPLDEVEA